MSFLQAITPINLLSEKEHFFSDQTYNPRFLYHEEVLPKKLLEHGLPKPNYLALAQEILKKTYFGRNEQDLYLNEGRALSQDEVDTKIKAFLALHKIEDRYQVVWSSSFVSRTTITSDTIKLRLPIDFRTEGLLGMLYHEVGTHALRRINYEQQPWFKKKKKYGFSDYLKTEEGIATLHALIPHSLKSAYVSALRYVAVDFAQKHTFAETWAALAPYIQDYERRWAVVLRQKRGVTDTSKPGGFTKDLVYFEGMVDVWQWLNQRQFSLTDLYYGKIALQDVPQAVALNPDFEPLLPSFFSHDYANYVAQMKEIGEYNMLDQL